MKAEGYAVIRSGKAELRLAVGERCTHENMAVGVLGKFPQERLEAEKASRYQLRRLCQPRSRQRAETLKGLRLHCRRLFP